MTFVKTTPYRNRVSIFSTFIALASTPHVGTRGDGEPLRARG